MRSCSPLTLERTWNADELLRDLHRRSASESARSALPPTVPPPAAQTEPREKDRMTTRRSSEEIHRTVHHLWHGSIDVELRLLSYQALSSVDAPLCCCAWRLHHLVGCSVSGGLSIRLMIVSCLPAIGCVLLPAVGYALLPAVVNALLSWVLRSLPWLFFFV